jgi:hypothetical protein
MCYDSFRNIMRSAPRSLPFILLNIIISAAVTLTVLVIWDKAHQVQTPSAVKTPSIPQEIVSGDCTAVIPPKSEEVIRITNVFGAGNLQEEQVTIQRVGDGELCLNGWKLSGDDGATYFFPAHLRLYTGGATIALFSRPGTDNALELFWGRTAPAWKSGGKSRIYDPDGNIRAVFNIP